MMQKIGVVECAMAKVDLNERARKFQDIERRENEKSYWIITCFATAYRNWRRLGCFSERSRLRRI
jgi:hypothetical protein